MFLRLRCQERHLLRAMRSDGSGQPPLIGCLSVPILKNLFNGFSEEPRDPERQRQ